MKVFRTSRHFHAPPEAVFAALRDPVRLARWWGPEGFSNSFESFDFQPGGHWHFVMHGPKGSHHPNHSVFVDIEPNTLVRLRHLSAPQFVLSIGLAPGDGGTWLSWEQDFDDPHVAAHVRHIVEPANEQNLDRLARELVPPGD